jgi:hypothetical protein
VDYGWYQLKREAFVAWYNILYLKERKENAVKVVVLGLRL